MFTFTFRNLDQPTRKHMLSEFDSDLATDKLYYSKRFTDKGREQYPTYMRDAITSGTDQTLADTLKDNGHMVASELREGAPVSAPHTAAQTLAEGEFNRFYARGVCLRAFDHGTNEVEVYRAKDVDVPREKSLAPLGQVFPASTLLDDLRLHVGVELALGLSGPNSGLSIFCRCGGCGEAA